MIFQIRLTLTTSFLLLLLFSLNQQLLAAIKISQASGNWSNVGSWGSAVPTDNDDVIISAGTIINLNASLPSSASLRSLIIQPGATLIVTVNGSTLRVKGNLINEGSLNLWQANNLQADIVLYGYSSWSGNGVWNLSSVNIQGNGLEISAGLSLTINGDLSANAGGSFNRINKYQDISLTFTGTVNSSLPAIGSDFYYGNIIVSKVSGAVNFMPSLSRNYINLNGNLVLINSTDRINIGNLNTLILQKSVTGPGVIGGGLTCSLIIDNPMEPEIRPLRMLSGTSLKSFVVNRTAGVVLATGFNVRDSLVLNNQCRLVLSNQTLSLGVNGATPSTGKFSGDGYLVGSAGSSISVRGNDPNPTYLRLGKLDPTEYTLNNLVIDKISGTTGLINGSSLIVKGTLDVSDSNIYSIGAASLTLNSVCNFFGSGCLNGSEESNLIIGGTGKTSYSLQFDQSTAAGHTLKSYFQSRRAMITLASKLNISERLSLTGDSSIFASKGNLTLLSSATQSSDIGPLLNSADVTGEVNVQVYLSGNSMDMKFRGYRSLSSPINDLLILDGFKKSIEQLKDYIIITGPGGVDNGFDQGGNAQPFAETLTIYNAHAVTGQPLFKPVSNIFQSVEQGAGFFAFFRGLQMGNYLLNAPKLNSPYIPPETVTVVYKGMINKFDIPGITLHNSNDSTNNYKGYNLIGNPYPSSIDWTKVSRSAGVNDEVITLKPGGGTATYINGFSNNGGSPYIQTGQGFYVRTAVDGSTVSFKEEDKTASYPARLLNLPLENVLLTYGQSSESLNYIKSDCKLIRLNLENGSDKDETTIVFKPDEKAEADYSDAIYFSGSTVNLSSLSANEKKLAINFMPDIHLVEEVNLSVNALSTGTYKLNFTDIQVSSMAVFLKDSFQQNELTELKKNLCYSFAIDKNNPATFGDKRFSLIFKPKKDKAQKTSSAKVKEGILAYPNPVINGEVLFDVTSLPEVDVQLFIFDLTGRKLHTFNFRKGEKIKANISQLQPGMYLAKFRSDRDGKALGESLFIKY